MTEKIADNKKKGTLVNGERYNFLNISFYRRFKKETKIDIEYRDFITIIDMSCRALKKKAIDNPLGIVLPEDLGYMAVSKYKSKRKKVDFNKTKLHGVTVYHNNFHSNGYDARIMWYKHKIARCKNIQEYKFVPDREFMKMKSHKLKEGFNYNSYAYNDFRNRKIKLNLDKLIYGDVE